MRFFLPIHIDGDNRGCQAITEATSLILNETESNILALSKNVHNDTFLGLTENVTLFPYPQDSFSFRIKRKIWKQIRHDHYDQECITYSHRYDSFLNLTTPNDVVLSTGGDMLCYYDNEVIYINELSKAKGCKSVLWGCSVGQENLTKRKIETLRIFDMIYVRESLSETVLKNIGLNNVYRFPDPAFILKPAEFELPIYMNQGDFVGINLSNFVSASSQIAEDYLQNIKNLFDYIINKTALKIVIIPHVLWERQDDRIVCGKIYELYKDTQRCFMFDTERYNYTQIRYLISRCKFFIGARTHSVISAYSTCVPTVALGYSIKSRGIAKDLGLSETTVVDSKHWKSSNDLLNAFKYIVNNEVEIKSHLLKVVPEYIKTIWGVRDVLNTIIKNNKL